MDANGAEGADSISRLIIICQLMAVTVIRVQLFSHVTNGFCDAQHHSIANPKIRVLGEHQLSGELSDRAEYISKKSNDSYYNTNYRSNAVRRLLL
jgi:hypothetical protein